MFLLWLCESVLIISISVIQNYLSKSVLRHFIFWGYYITARSTACLLHLQYLNWWYLYNVHVINVLLIFHMTSLYCFSIDDQERMSIFSTIWQFSDVALGTISPRSLLWKRTQNMPMLSRQGGVGSMECATGLIHHWVTLKNRSP